ncbi:phage tail assembly chaperone [Pseudopontixanthobacter vadosimaris]|uniref:phage tail assembly chaperone n=1 Tax=Pseudopontixanthobacter vadosimaris TaxID=2726450 RepID=UPI0014752139
MSVARPNSRDDDASFGPRALRLAGLAARSLGWRPPEFWNSTPAELTACLTAEPQVGTAPPSRTDIQRMIEADRHG